MSLVHNELDFKFCCCSIPFPNYQAAQIIFFGYRFHLEIPGLYKESLENPAHSLKTGKFDIIFPYNTYMKAGTEQVDYTGS